MVCAPVVVEIEVHTAEERQQFHTRYSVDKYKALTQQLQHLIGDRLSQEGIDHSVVLNPELKGGWKPYFFVPNYYVKSDKSRKFYPRLGAFEVTVRCAEDFRSGTGLPPCLELWSKLRTRRWPKPDRLVEDLARLLVAGRQGDETHPILMRIKGKLEEAEKLRCESPATTASSLNLAKPPAGPIAVSLRGRSRPDSAPPSRARPESAPPVGDDGKASAPRRLKPLSRAPSASRPPLARPPATSRPASARAPPAARPASACASRTPRPMSARSEYANSVKDEPRTAEQPAAVPQVFSPAAAKEEAAVPQAAEEQLLEACELADILSGPAVVPAAGPAAHQEPPSIMEAQPTATPSPSPKHRGRGTYEDEDFEESECGGSPKATAQPPLHLLATAETLPAGTDRFGMQQEAPEEFEAEFGQPIKGKADISAESTDVEEEVGPGTGRRSKKSLTAGGASSTSGSTRGTVTPVDTTGALTTATGSFKDALQARLGQSHRLSDEASGTSGSNLPSPAQGSGSGTARTALPPKLPEAPEKDAYDDFEDDFEQDLPAATPPPTAAPAAQPPSTAAQPPPSPAVAPARPSSAVAQARPASAGLAVGLATAGLQGEAQGEAKPAAADRSQTFEDPYDEGFEQTLTDEHASPARDPTSAAQDHPRGRQEELTEQEEQRPQQQTMLPAAVAAATAEEKPATAAPADPRDASKDPYDETFEQTLRDESGGVKTPEREKRDVASEEPRETQKPAAYDPAVAPMAAIAEERCEARAPAAQAPVAAPAAAAAQECQEPQALAAKAPAAAPATPAAHQEPASPREALEEEPSPGVTGDYDSDFEDE